MEMVEMDCKPQNERGRTYIGPTDIPNPLPDVLNDQVVHRRSFRQGMSQVDEGLEEPGEGGGGLSIVQKGREKE